MTQEQQISVEALIAALRRADSRTAGDFVGLLKNIGGMMNAEEVEELVVGYMPTSARTNPLALEGHIHNPRASGLLFIRKDALQDVTNSAALQDDDHFTFALGSDETWLVNMTIFIGSGTNLSTMEMRFAWALPSGASLFAVGMWFREGTANIAAKDVRVTATPGSGLPLRTDANSRHILLIQATLRNGGTAGTATLRWAQNTANASPLRFDIDSFMLAHKID